MDTRQSMEDTRGWLELTHVVGTDVGSLHSRVYCSLEVPGPLPHHRKAKARDVLPYSNMSISDIRTGLQAGLGRLHSKRL